MPSDKKILVIGDPGVGKTVTVDKPEIIVKEEEPTITSLAKDKLNLLKTEIDLMKNALNFNYPSYRNSKGSKFTPKKKKRKKKGKKTHRKK